MSIYTTGHNLRHPTVEVLHPDGTREEVAGTRTVGEALQVIHYLNGGSDPAAAALVADYDDTAADLPNPVADAVRGLVPKRWRKGRDDDAEEAPEDTPPAGPDHP